ncbi:hypothetical protein BJY16_008050 [Actinoplanes octamycinicus]|uniref:DUF3455 domain-containing protein n=1 Tax=Actinoplanes octamycinicus TaxID=135948 RepID=A0A7W7H5Y3_9ACTN|nr:DUF3455 domain-containing protein [Actinoplanes octamycinicus]MBB4744591.1 hypothetical protein [Actinoplanes octamycinicus]GIE63780.1 hypothetical protein Aoc01nite_91820 [Actinoplanes octamycinicus]
MTRTVKIAGAVGALALASIAVPAGVSYAGTPFAAPVARSATGANIGADTGSAARSAGFAGSVTGPASRSAAGSAPGATSGLASGPGAESASGATSGLATGPGAESASGAASGLATGPGAGSANGPATGLAAGSANGLATGLAAGSATGSATGSTTGSAGGSATTQEESFLGGEPLVPDAVEPPAGNVVHAVLKARGVQIYECKRSMWQPLEPAASLTGVTMSPVKKVTAVHFRGPAWVSDQDGSMVQGAAPVTAQPAEPGSLPPMLLKATGNRGGGIFGPVTYIQRLDAHGGAAPSTSCGGDQPVAVPYRAVYRFFTTK